MLSLVVDKVLISTWLLRSCYAFAMVSQVVAKVLLGFCYVIPGGCSGIARTLLSYPWWLLRYC